MFSIVSKISSKKRRRARLRKDIITFLSSLPRQEISEEQSEVLNYLIDHEFAVFPYPFNHEYHKRDIEVCPDKTTGLKYVMLKDKKLFFKRSSSRRGIRRNFNRLRKEQDVRSPHRYLTLSFTVEKDDIVADIGAGEGNFALSVVDRVKKLYLFETNPQWIEALRASFYPWRDKVEIINQFVSDHDDDAHVSLDRFFLNREPATFLKVDVEGAEAAFLRGCSTLLASNTPLKIAICSYHKSGDETQFRDLLVASGFDVEATPGFMLYTGDRNLRAPYLRRGLIRGVKICS